MRVQDFCLKKTQAKELCVFRDQGWIVGATWIDYEDLFIISHDIRDGVVISDEWGTLPIITEYGDKMEIPCHYIDFKW